MSADTIVRPDTTENTELEDGPVAHIVKCGPGESAVAKVTKARVFGTPITALCGHVWVPDRNPRNYPVCQQCKEIYELYRMSNENLGETPDD